MINGIKELPVTHAAKQKEYGQITLLAYSNKYDMNIINKGKEMSKWAKFICINMQTNSKQNI
jgi:hypothetical protein